MKEAVVEVVVVVQMAVVRVETEVVLTYLMLAHIAQETAGLELQEQQTLAAVVVEAAEEPLQVLVAVKLGMVQADQAEAVEVAL
jgi:hypothetical protein